MLGATVGDASAIHLPIVPQTLAVLWVISARPPVAVARLVMVIPTMIALALSSPRTGMNARSRPPCARASGWPPGCPGGAPQKRQPVSRKKLRRGEMRLQVGGGSTVLDE
ncbi:unnamed protein product [Prorocentrum cordatum]|uniref:Uncharacterized protein n=1 Tax=Prorocentrum cordatum TaxID=2364126 RepID=A0ABN9SVQ7_9DINO|nr:unnamed protein product [Polarella glacialis]